MSLAQGWDTVAATGHSSRPLVQASFRYDFRLSRKPGVPGVYVEHESARMAEFDGVPLASFTARAVAFFIDFMIAAPISVAAGVAGALAAIKLGWIKDNVHLEFDLFHHENWASLVFFALFIARPTTWATAHLCSSVLRLFQYFIHLTHRTVYDRIA
jgi:hypothetical protein